MLYYEVNMNFLFYDLETTGLKPGPHRPVQFAAILTDHNLKELKRVNWVIKLSSEILPDPYACLVTGITPQSTKEGMSEPEFLKKLHEELLLPGTVVTGYNTIQFDDEFMRYTLWRNFYDPYEWQWKEGRSRWDILTLVRMTRALRPEGIEWPFKPDGKPINTLGEIAKANKLEHTSAHDALSDVEVTVDIARLIKEKAPKLFDFLLSLRDKKVAESYLDLEAPKPVVHTTTRFPSENLHTSVVYPLCPTPGRAGGVLAYDLRHDPSEFFTLSSAQLKRLTYTKRNSLGEYEEERLPVKMVQFNKCPALAPLEVLTPPTAARINLDLKKIQANLAKLKQGLPAFSQKVYEAYKPEDGKFPPKDDPDLSLYDGFLNDTDRNLSSAVRVAKPKDLKLELLKFEDGRLTKLLTLYKARNFPDQLTENEAKTYQEYKMNKIINGTSATPPLEVYLQDLDKLSKTKLSKSKLSLINDLKDWAQQSSK
ncbi:MAG: exodeoxyribonuclease [Patescibacteria group bacterium]|nr:exodeoxyribonuclease [Patescibacteria group bacterium]